VVAPMFRSCPGNADVVATSERCLEPCRYGFDNPWTGSSSTDSCHRSPAGIVYRRRLRGGRRLVVTEADGLHLTTSIPPLPTRWCSPSRSRLGRAPSLLSSAIKPRGASTSSLAPARRQRHNADTTRSARYVITAPSTSSDGPVILSRGRNTRRTASRHRRGPAILSDVLGSHELSGTLVRVSRSFLTATTET